MKVQVAMKPMFEKVLASPDCSWRYCLYELDHIPFNWHYHPEYEIALTVNGEGMRYVGDHIDAFTAFDLVFTGPDLPHTWHTQIRADGQMQRVHVAQIPLDWIEHLSQLMPEMRDITDLFERSKRGLKFSRHCAELVEPLFADLRDANPLQRFSLLLQILQVMLNDNNTCSLASLGYRFNGVEKDIGLDRIERVIQYIHEHFTEDLCADKLAKHAHMSTSYFHRFFKQRTEQTFNELVTELRIGKACTLLLENALPIATISVMCGFNNLSNFNRRFKQLKGISPSQFRLVYVDGKDNAWAKHVKA